MSTHTNFRSAASRLAGALAAAGLLGAGATAQAKPDVTGVWVIEKPSKTLLTSDGAEPPLLPESRALYEARRKRLADGDAAADPVLDKCAMPGTPRILSMPYPFQIFESGLRVVFVHEFNRNFRSIEIADSVAPADYETAYGRGRARFDGDWLVIETNGLTDETFLDSAGLPHSNGLALMEAYRLLDGGERLEARLRIEDPAVYSAPWEATLTFRRLKDYQLREDVCLDRKADGEPVIDWKRRTR